MTCGAELDVRQAKAVIVPEIAVNRATGLVVLVVEDEFFVRCDIAACLRDAGYEVIEVASGEEAMALCRSDVSIDLVFTDINLSGAATGWDVAECFRIDYPAVGVVYTSGKSIDRQRCVSDSVFVAKPYNSAEVLDLCGRVTGRDR